MTNPNTNPKLLEFIDAARKEIGYRALAFNESEFARMAGYPLEPWDGALLEHARRAANLGGPCLTGTTAALAEFVRERRLYAKPRPGDVAFFAFSTHTKFSQPHVGVVTDTSQFRKRGFFRVLEGQIDAGLRRTNTEESGVHERTRHTDDVIGFGRLPLSQHTNTEIRTDAPTVSVGDLTTGRSAQRVAEVQLALAETVDLRQATRGVLDDRTRVAYARWQREVGVYGEHGKPDAHSLHLLGERTGRFRSGE